MPATADEKAKVQTLEVQLGRIDIALKIIGAAVVFAATSLGYVAYQAGHVVSSVNARKDSIADLKADFKSRDKQIADSLDRIEKALAQNPPTRPKPG